MAIALKTLSDEEQKDYGRYQVEVNLAANEWLGEMGDRWATRNPTDVEATDLSWMQRYGSPKTYIVHDALRGVPKQTKWLELGCAAGAHMRVIERDGFTGVLGTDLNMGGLPEAPGGRVCQSDAAMLPFADQSIDGIATSGTLMHFGPAPRMTQSINEILRVARKYVFIIELWSATGTLVVFGDLLPPAWLYPWEESLLPFLGDEWSIKYQKIYSLTSKDGEEDKRAPMCVMLIERKGL